MPFPPKYGCAGNCNCPSCPERHRARKRIQAQRNGAVWRERRKALGQCKSCAAPLFKWGRCERHYLDEVQRRKAKRAA